MHPLQDPPRFLGHLTRAPLDRVVCQVKFPPVYSIAAPDFIGPFQQRIRERYPRASQSQGIRFQLNLSGNEAPSPTPIPMMNYVFEDEAQQWRVTLSPDSISLDTGSYISHEDFLENLAKLIEALETCIHPTHRTRIGVRYINRIQEPESLEAVPGLFRSEILGILSYPNLVGQVDQTITEAIMATPECKLLARWGLLAANSTYEPMMVPPKPGPSWMLDLDAFSEERKTFKSDEIVADATALTERACAFFQWAITDKFLTYFR